MRRTGSRRCRRIAGEHARGVRRMPAIVSRGYDAIWLPRRSLLRRCARCVSSSDWNGASCLFVSAFNASILCSGRPSEIVFGERYRFGCTTRRPFAPSTGRVPSAPWPAIGDFYETGRPLPWVRRRGATPPEGGSVCNAAAELDRGSPGRCPWSGTPPNHASQCSRRTAPIRPRA